jgi:hypothetical protein
LLPSAEARRRVSLMTERDRWVCARNYKHLAPLEQNRIQLWYLRLELPELFSDRFVIVKG